MPPAAKFIPESIVGFKTPSMVGALGAISPIEFIFKWKGHTETSNEKETAEAVVENLQLVEQFLAHPDRSETDIKAIFKNATTGPIRDLAFRRVDGLVKRKTHTDRNEEGGVAAKKTRYTSPFWAYARHDREKWYCLVPNCDQSGKFNNNTAGVKSHFRAKHYEVSDAGSTPCQVPVYCKWVPKSRRMG